MVAALAQEGGNGFCMTHSRLYRAIEPSIQESSNSQSEEDKSKIQPVLVIQQGSVRVGRHDGSSRYRAGCTLIDTSETWDQAFAFRFDSINADGMATRQGERSIAILDIHYCPSTLAFGNKAEARLL